MFWDWESGKVVYWSTTDSLVAIVAEDSFYMLSLTVTAYEERLTSGVEWRLMMRVWRRRLKL
ncbi:hypothetical protein BT96DRAFT_926070, partial [Gymnopus androsaceus JB14]